MKSMKSMALDSGGFTLLETLLALTIMSTALVLLAQTWSSGFARVQKTQQVFEMAHLLERKMIEIELEYRNRSLEEIREEKDGDFGKEFPGYTWKMKSQKLEFPDLSSALISRKDGADEMLLSVVQQMTDYFSKSIKEVTVIVAYTGKNQKPIEQSLTTYFVDYDQELSLGLPTGALGSGGGGS